jgi:hypothetical protein
VVKNKRPILLGSLPEFIPALNPTLKKMEKLRVHYRGVIYSPIHSGTLFTVIPFTLW